MTSEKDYNKHKTEKQLSQLKDRLDKEGVGDSRYICPPPSCAAPLGRAPCTGVTAAGFGHLPLQLDLHQVMLNAPWATVHVWNKWEAQISTSRTSKADGRPDKSAGACACAGAVVSGADDSQEKSHGLASHWREKELRRKGTQGNVLAARKPSL